MTPRPRPTRAVTWAVVLGAVLSGCAGLAPDPAVAAARATDFLAAVAGQDGAAACAMLAPATAETLVEDAGAPCEEALLAPEISGSLGTGEPSADAQAFGRQALVRFAADTVFLTRDGRDWVVTAAGCTPSGDDSYDCTIEGS